MLHSLQKMLRKEYIQIEKRSAARAAARSRSRNYKIWRCEDCGHAYFYGVMKCPLCESANIEQTVHEPNLSYKDVVYGEME